MRCPQIVSLENTATLAHFCLPDYSREHHIYDTTLWLVAIKIRRWHHLLASLHVLILSLSRGIIYMMTSSNGNIFRVTGPLCGEVTSHGWIPCTKASGANFDVFFDLRLINGWVNGWVNNREAGDLRRHRAHYGVIVVTNMNWASAQTCIPWVWGEMRSSWFVKHLPGFLWWGMSSGQVGGSAEKRETILKEETQPRTPRGHWCLVWTP